MVAVGNLGDNTLRDRIGECERLGHVTRQGADGVEPGQGSGV
jgi:hypothetical protein